MSLTGLSPFFNPGVLAGFCTRIPAFSAVCVVLSFFYGTEVAGGVGVFECGLVF